MYTYTQCETAQMVEVMQVHVHCTCTCTCTCTAMQHCIHVHVQHI